MRVYVVEDKLFELEDISISLENLGHEIVGTSDNASKAKEDIAAIKPEVILIDIHLKKRKGGIELAKILKQTSNIPYIFTSSEISDEIVQEATDTHPIAYLTKPVVENNLKAALLLAKAKTKDTITKKLEELFIKSGNKLIRVLIDSILFVHTDTKNYCTIVTQDGRKLTVRNSILGLKKFLNDDTFVQTHRSHIINWQKIDFFHESDQAIYIQDHLIPIGRTFKSDIYSKLNVI